MTKNNKLTTHQRSNGKPQTVERDPLTGRFAHPRRRLTDSPVVINPTILYLMFDAIGGPASSTVFTNEERNKQERVKRNERHNDKCKREADKWRK